MMKKTSRKIVYHTWTILLIALIMGFASCHKNDPDHNGDNPGSGGDNPSIPVVTGDPEGTVTINLNNGADGNWYNIGIGMIHIDNANNFEGMDFVCIGEVDGLGYVTSIPTEGWSNTVAVVPGKGYVTHYQNHYARLYVVEYYTSTGGGIMGATVKYQSPFQVPISLETSSLTFDKGEETKSVKLTCPTSVSIEGKPDWCSVSVSFDTISVSVTENTSIQRSAEIVLKNELSIERISITQQGIAPITLETTSLTFSKEGGSQTVIVVNPTIITVEEKPEWCTISIDDNTIIVSVSENTSELRSGEIVLMNDVNTVRLVVTQQGIAPITLETTSLTFSKEGGSQTVTIVNPTIMMVEEKPVWCIVSVDSNTITVSVAENMSMQQRTGEIVLKNEISSASLFVTQFAYEDIFSETFANGQGSFTIQDVVLPSELNFVWQPLLSYSCMKASAYAGQAYNAESWLVSPVINLSGFSSARLRFSQAVNYALPNGMLSIMISTDYNGDVTAATWTELSLDQWPAGNNWTFITSTADLTPYIGQTVNIAFKYTSTTSASATWEVKDFVVEE